MSDDIRKELAHLLRTHGTPLGGQDEYPGDEYDCCVDTILKRFLVTPHAKIKDTEEELDRAAQLINHLRVVEEARYIYANPHGCYIQTIAYARKILEEAGEL